MQYGHLVGQHMLPPHLNNYAPRLLPLVRSFLQRALSVLLYEIPSGFHFSKLVV